MAKKKVNPKSLANLTPVKPGQVLNPKGRTKAGASAREWLNVFSEKQLTESELRAIARNPRIDFIKRGAAERAIRLMEAADIVAFEPWLTGKATLADLKAAGVNTEMVKKAKITDKGGRELELYDRAGIDFDRIVEHTDGKAKEEVTVKGEGTGYVGDEELLRIAAELGVPLPARLKRADPN